MSQQVDGAYRTFPAGGARGKYLRVKLASGVLALAGITDKDMGVLRDETFASGDLVAVRLASAAGTTKMIAAAAIVAGAEVYTAASGKVSVSATTALPIGSAVEAAGADGDIIEVMRTGFGTAVPV